MCITTTRTTKSVLVKPSIITQHNYHDHSHDIQTTTTPIHPLSQPVSTMLFPAKLHRMLSQIEQDGFANIISWQPHGRCFVIQKPDEFKAFILPRYFDTNKISSFQRQLSLYGFTRLSRGRDRGGYYHELFLRGKPSLVDGIVRTKVKGTRVRAKANPKDEPNLWFMSWVGVSGSHDKEDDGMTIHSSSTQRPQPQHLIVPNEVVSSSVPTSTISTMSNEGVVVSDDEYCNDIAMFAGRHFHCVASLSAMMEAEGLLSNIQEWESDVELVLGDHSSIDSDDDFFISILECISSS